MTALSSLPSDASAWLLPRVRAALHALDDDEVTPVIRRLRAAPTSRLAGGRVRRELDELLAEGGPPWRALVDRIRAEDTVPDAVARLLAGPADEATSTRDPQAAPDRGGRQDRSGGHDPSSGQDPAAAARERAEARARDRLREVRAERDELRRQLTGAAARAAASERDAARTDAELAAAHDRIAELERALASAGEERDRAVDRERRRRDGEIARLEAAVTDLRRAEEERAQDRRRQAERARVARDEASRQIAGHRSAPVEPGPSRLVPGRPSRLPPDVHRGTTEEAALLLHAGRLVLVDGYNVTKQHQGDLDLEGQRAWLVRILAALAARRRVRPTAVFDGQQAGGSRPAMGGREVGVVFTPAGVTADDELVLAVEATDEPVVVVTDDRELAGRVAASGADVIGTRAFLGVAR